VFLGEQNRQRGPGKPWGKVPKDRGVRKGLKPEEEETSLGKGTDRRGKLRREFKYLPVSKNLWLFTSPRKLFRGANALAAIKQGNPINLKGGFYERVGLSNLWGKFPITMWRGGQLTLGDFPTHDAAQRGEYPPNWPAPLGGNLWGRSLLRGLWLNSYPQKGGGVHFELAWEEVGGRPPTSRSDPEDFVQTSKGGYSQKCA